MKPTLLILAAGMGSRFGGLKQVEPVGPNGEAIIDYSIYDAIRAGFGKVVFVIREHFADAFREIFDPKLKGQNRSGVCIPGTG
jgi:choline kinase